MSAVNPPSTARQFAGVGAPPAPPALASSASPNRGGVGTSPSAWMITVTSEHASGLSLARTDRSTTAFTGACTPNANACPRKKSTANAANVSTQNASSRNANATNPETAQTRIAARASAPAESAATPPAIVPATPATTVIPPSTTSERLGVSRSEA